MTIIIAVILLPAALNPNLGPFPITSVNKICPIAGKYALSPAI
jgi:hypothetical protein